MLGTSKVLNTIYNCSSLYILKRNIVSTIDKKLHSFYEFCDVNSDQTVMVAKSNYSIGSISFA